MELDQFLQQVVVVLATAVAVQLLSFRLKVPPLAALLLTGLVIGPSGLGLASDSEVIHTLAEIGVVLLLFVIGLELSFGKLKQMRRSFFVGGSVQATITLAIAGGLAAASGLAPGPAIFFGFVIVLSSTAIVLKLYGDRRESDAPHAQVALAILIFQDFLIVPMIVLTPVLGGEVAASAGELASRFGGAFLAVAAVLAGARYLMPWLFLQFVRSRVREVFVLGALGICLAMAWLTHALGFSLALGAFVAGILVSETEYSHQVVADMVPFRDVFASVFFISMGMLVDLELLASRAPLVLGLALAIIVLKALACAVAVALLRFPARTVALAALGLAQIGEFSFVLMEVGHAHGLLQGQSYQLLLSAAVVTMLATPALMRLGPVVAEAWLRLRRRPVTDGDDSKPSEGRSGHVVVVGFGVGGRLLSRVLREVGISYVALELNGETVRRAQAEGEPVVYGDATRRELLEHVGIERASVVVLAINDPAAARRAVHLARQLNPKIEIIARTRLVKEIEELQALGADQVVAEEFETAIEIFTRVLTRFHVPRNIVRVQTRVLRGEGYRMLRAPSLIEGVSETLLEALEAGTTDIFRVERASASAGRTLLDLDLRRRTGASVITVVRGEESYPNPAADLVLEAGDSLVLMGSHDQVDKAFQLLT
ncbi:MAG: cation:proton antiporter [Acidobacteriota bacterium]